jgi:AsmA protein
MADTVTSPGVALPASGGRIRKTVWFALTAVGAVLSIAVVAPHFIDLGLFKRTYLPLVEEALNRRIDVGEVWLTLLPRPSIRLSNLRVYESAAAPTEGTFFSAEQVKLRVRFLPLLKGRFEASELVLEKPRFNFVKQADGTFNYSDIADQKNPSVPTRYTKRRINLPRSAEGAAVPWLIPANVSIRGGRLHLIASHGPPIILQAVDVTLRDVASGAPFPFRAAFDYPGLKSVSLQGEMLYREDKALLELKNNLLAVHDLRVPVEGSISNIAAAPKLNLQMKGENLDARRVFEALAVFGLAPRDTEVSGPMNLHINITGPTTQLLTEMRGFLKDVRVHGKRAFKGTLRGEIALRVPAGAGPATRRMQGNGKLAARNGELTHTDLIRKIERVTGMIGLSKEERRQATTFDSMEADFNIADGIAKFTRLYFTNPQMAVTGDGTMTVEQPVVNLAISTTLSPQASNRAGRGRLTTFFKDKQGRVVVPLRVAGPVENPSVELNTGKLVGPGLPQNAEKGFGSFFRQLFRSR